MIPIVQEKDHKPGFFFTRENFPPHFKRISPAKFNAPNIERSKLNLGGNHLSKAPFADIIVDQSNALK